MAIRLNVLMGGPSAEYEVSLNSGSQVLTHIDKSKYNLRAVVINKDKQFYYADVVDGNVPDVHSYADSGSVFKGPFHPSASKEIWDDCDVAFLALHGEYGEDGVIQGFLEAIGITYTGSNVYASAVAMNKITSKFLYETAGLSVPDYSVYGVNHPNVTVDSIIKKHGFPCFLKCPQSGSSRLMGRASDRESLESLLKELQESADDILVETTVTGIEFSCGVINMPDGTTKALPPIEIRPADTSSFFDYKAKYSKGGSTEIVPAPQPEELLKRIQDAAVAAHRVLGCYGVSRTDMIYDDKNLRVLETNTLPGMTSTSLLPQAYKAMGGGTYAELLDVLIRSALAKKRP
ncbi:MAG: D-alanine--D-alanine ligase [Chitinispirillia bacterium]|nr:D-alanine--D-alanine ligase [Chitinispirillia bacterium]MCL2267988.1 D-alanine--D-alanine ligase [Chitinispirillia bacterium]